MHLKELKNRIERAEAGPVRSRAVDDMTDEELIEAAGLAPYWQGLTEPQCLQLQPETRSRNVGR
jgi:hypothetical protein